MFLVSYTFFWICSFLTDFIVLGFFLLLIPAVYFVESDAMIFTTACLSLLPGSTNPAS